MDTGELDCPKDREVHGKLSGPGNDTPHPMVRFAPQVAGDLEDLAPHQYPVQNHSSDARTQDFIDLHAYKCVSHVVSHNMSSMYGQLSDAPESPYC